tara:strand:+ start:10823 stop:10924 length:102 start_codon:yes stop_codon:yes gene_type:complete
MTHGVVGEASMFVQRSTATSSITRPFNGYSSGI